MIMGGRVVFNGKNTHHRFVSFSCFGMWVTACRFLVYFFRLALFIYIFFPEKIWSPDNFPHATHATSISVFSLQNFWGRTTPWREWWGWGWLVTAIQLPSKNGTVMYFPMLEPGRWFCFKRSFRKFSASKIGGRFEPAVTFLHLFHAWVAWNNQPRFRIPESSKGLKPGPFNHQKQTWGLKFDTLEGSIGICGCDKRIRKSSGCEKQMFGRGPFEGVLELRVLLVLLHFGHHEGVCVFFFGGA